MIQRGAERALKAGHQLCTKVLEIARTIRKTSQIPLLLFTYLNPVMRYGLDKLARDAKAAGIDGCLLTDLSVEEAAPYVAAMRAAGLDTVFLGRAHVHARTIEAGRRNTPRDSSTWFREPASPGEQASLSESVAPLVDSMRAITQAAAGRGIRDFDAAAGARSRARWPTAWWSAALSCG